MARWAIFDLLNMFFCSTFHALSNRKKNIFVPIEMTTLCNSTFFQRLLHRLLYITVSTINLKFFLTSIFFRGNNLSTKCTCRPKVRVGKTICHQSGFSKVMRRKVIFAKVITIHSRNDWCFRAIFIND